jgi:hypothetical protein
MTQTCEINEYGTTRWYNKQGQLHRLDGPAVILDSGQKEWYVNDLRHREDGPAIEYPEGSKEWWLNGKRHRLDGPAVEWSDGWFINGVQYSKENFPQAIIMYLLGSNKETAEIILELYED